MKFRVEIRSKISEQSGHVHDRDGWIKHFNDLMEGLIEVGAENPAVDADLEAGAIEVEFLVEGESDAEAIQTAVGLFIAALKASGAELNEVSLDSVSKKELIPA